MLAGAQAVQAQARQQVSFNLPAGPLPAALAAFGRQAGLQVTYRPEIASGKRSPGLSGALPPDMALGRLLQGSGLAYRFTGARTVAIVDPAAPGDVGAVADGSTLLGAINVTAGGGNPVERPYETPGATAYISEENIERFRGSNPADMFQGTPGVMSGEARNAGSAIDVNIRGMQGMGRVEVTVDGAENAVTVYQGYQGISNRTFVDPDLLAGIDITKGSDVASNGIAGTVAMRTLDAGDIVKEGNRFGVRLKGGFGTNTRSPKDGAVSGYDWPSGQPDAPTPSPDGMNRPSFLTPTSGSGSVVGAYKGDRIDLLAAYAYRKRGNYYAGEEGPGAEPVNIGPREYCTAWGNCSQVEDYYVNGGLTNYRPGEEVLNTQLETESWLGKATVRFGDGHSLKLGYTGFRSEAGDRLASRLTSGSSQATQQPQTAGTRLDTGTLHYNWQPDDNDLIALKANLWFTHLELRNPKRTGFTLPEPGDFRPGSDSDLWGGEIANTSRLSTGFGAVDVDYGISYRGEDTRPSPGTKEAETWLDLRDGIRHEVAGFAKMAWQARDWLTVEAGLRYAHVWSKDRNDPYLERNYTYDSSFNDGGFSPSVGVTVEPVDWAQLYVRYSNVMRAPSIIESVSAFTMNVNENLRPERSSNWEIGANLIGDGLIAAGDRGMVKLGYFNWVVDNYIAREWYTYPNGSMGMRIFNIDSASFSGLELSGRYEIGGFAAELAANYYLDVEFCRTADSCESKSLYADYATNQVPPEYSVDLTLSQRFFGDALTVGGRVSHIGPRAVGHGDVTGQGMSQFITKIDWKPYTLFDVFAEYRFNENFTASARIENLMDKYYVDPLSLVNQPGPGRTFYASLTASF
ncbi:TonB-dependent receptor [Kaustia mangrovi]|uniref:TonB-dependent receptor n=2 Tax=Kaustia mangrovi TaxID=2593653 RepID=A0A7S8HEF0_9HYPH|nr:TonB-dependent receptor [Kaustia mangrovi]